MYCYLYIKLVAFEYTDTQTNLITCNNERRCDRILAYVAKYIIHVKQTVIIHQNILIIMNYVYYPSYGFESYNHEKVNFRFCNAYKKV